MYIRLSFKYLHIHSYSTATTIKKVLKSEEPLRAEFSLVLSKELSNTEKKTQKKKFCLIWYFIRLTIYSHFKICATKKNIEIFPLVKRSFFMYICHLFKYLHTYTYTTVTKFKEILISEVQRSASFSFVLSNKFSVTEKVWNKNSW